MFEKYRSSAGVALICLLCGCGGDGLNRVPVAGNVTFGGEPVTNGSISLLPASNTAGPAVGAPIESGRFEIAADQGPVPGNYRVEIRASRTTGRKIVDQFRQPPDNLIDEIEQFIPRQYNAESSLTLVVGTAANEARFDLRLINGR